MRRRVTPAGPDTETYADLYKRTREKIAAGLRLKLRENEVLVEVATTRPQFNGNPEPLKQPFL